MKQKSNQRRAMLMARVAATVAVTAARVVEAVESFLFTEFTRSSQTSAKPPFVAVRSRELPKGLDDGRAVTGHSEAGGDARGGGGHRGMLARVHAAVGRMRERAKRASEWARRWYYRDAG